MTDEAGAHHRPSRRNTSAMIDAAASSFDAAHYHGIMALYATPMQGRSVRISSTGAPIVDFVRCSYLGLDNHPAIVEGAAKAVEMTGVLHWSCARTRLNFGILENLEADLSRLFQAHIVTFTTVLAANMSALPLLASGHLTRGRKPLMVFDRLAHATLAYHKSAVAEDTSVETIPHNDLNTLEALCKSNPQVVYVCDGAYSMGGQAPLEELRTLQEKYGLFLYIDDAHGISIEGKNGAGFARSFLGELGERTIVAASLGKGYGASGGLLMLGTPAQELLFRRFAIAYAFSASLNTAAIGAALASASIHRSEELRDRQRALRDNLALLDGLLPTRHSSSPLPIRTIHIGDELQAVAAARYLLEQGYYTSAIFFPTVARGEAGLRVCLTSSHTHQQIRELAAEVHALKAELASDQPGSGDFHRG